MIDSGMHSRKYCKPWNGYRLVSHKWLLTSTVPRIPWLVSPPNMTEGKSVLRSIRVIRVPFLKLSIQVKSKAPCCW
jgi:hypothetical protein